LKKRFVYAAVLAALLGSALHFLYDLVPAIPSAILSPINESPWEHLKLLFWPTLLAAFVLTRRAENKERMWSAFFLALLVMPCVLLAAYYLMVALGADSLWADITLYFLTMFFGFFLAYRLRDSEKIGRIGGFLLMLVILYGSSLVLFSFAAPDLPVFRAQ